MLQQATRSTLTLPSDVALSAAEEFDKLLSDFTAKGLLAEFDEAAWRAMEDGGWLVAGKDSEGASLDLLDLIELAIVWGRHLIPAPFISTVIAQRWMGVNAASSRRGFTYSLAPVAGALAPFGSLAGTTFLSSIGPNGAQTGLIAATGVDDFAPSLPLTEVAVGTRCDPEVARETIVLHAAVAVGICEALLKKTVDYANFRKAYDQEIGKFQAIRHRMADVHRDIEACRGLLLTAVNDKERGTGACRLIAKLSRGMVEACLQTHGAIGFTWDLGIHRYLRHTIALDKLLASYARAAAPVPG
jgi:hypothetical protein